MRLDRFIRTIAPIFAFATNIGFAWAIDPITLQEKQKLAAKRFQERCAESGEKINTTAAEVDGILLLKIRPKEPNYIDQFLLTDPYGNDAFGDQYIFSFLRGYYHKSKNWNPDPVSEKFGFNYVETIDGSGKRIRYVKNIEEPWLENKSYAKGFKRFSAQTTKPIPPVARYAVNFEDISSEEDRKLWIAGSSLTVIDTETGKVMGQRIGYMVDWSQGNDRGGRSPWLAAAENACPTFKKRSDSNLPGYVWQRGQTLDFVEKVLKPKGRQ